MLNILSHFHSWGQTQIHHGLDFIKHTPSLGFLFAFLISLAESLPIIGTIIPGSVTMTALGTLIGTGTLPFTSTIFFAFLGAFIGDFLGYYLGFYYHAHIRNISYLKKHPMWLEKGEAFFDRHGGKSILIGRFFGPIRSSIPMIAGILQLPIKRFITAAAPSALLWSLVYTGPGIALGKLALTVPKGKISQFIFIGLVAVAIIWAFAWAAKRLSKVIAKKYIQTLSNWWEKKQRHPLLHPLRIKKHTEMLPAYYNIHLMIIGLVLFLVFTALWLSTIFQWGIDQLNTPLLYLLRSFQSDHNRIFFIAITTLGDKIALISSLFLLTIYWLYKKFYKPIVMLLGGFALSAVALLIIKHLYFHPRPFGLAKVALSSSFPSGHVTLSVVVYGLLAFFLGINRPRWQRQTIHIIAISIIFAVSVSRLWLGMHWLCDVLAALCLGLCILNACKIFYLSTSVSHVKIPILPVALSFLIGTVSIYQWHHKTIFFDTQLDQSKKIVSYQSWWKDPLDSTEAIRYNRLHHASEPLNIQWAGDLDTIKSALKEFHLSQIPSGHWAYFINLLLNTHQDWDKHFFKQLYQYQAPIIHASLNEKNRTLYLDLWQAPITFKNHAQPLYTGTIYYTTTSPKDKKNKHYQAKLLHRFTQENQTKLIQHPSNHALNHKKIDWDGEIIILTHRENKNKLKEMDKTILNNA